MNAEKKDAAAIEPGPTTSIRGEGPQLGPQLDAVPVKSIDSFGLCEDNETLLVIVELVDGRTVALSFCPGQAITAGVVA